MKNYIYKAKSLLTDKWIEGAYLPKNERHFLILSIMPFKIEEINIDTLCQPTQLREVSVEEEKFKKHIYENDIIEFYLDRLCDYSPQSKYDGKVKVRGVVKYNKYCGNFHIETKNTYNMKIFEARGKEKYDRYLPSWVSMDYNFAYHHSDDKEINKIIFRKNRPHIFKYHNVKIIGNVFDNEHLLKEEPTL